MRGPAPCAREHGAEALRAAHRLQPQVSSIALSFVDLALGLGAADLGLLSSVFSLAMLVPSLSVSVSRLDVGRSGWWLLLVLVPVIGWLVLLVFACTDSQPGANPWGDNPKEGGAQPIRTAHAHYGG